MLFVAFSMIGKAQFYVGISGGISLSKFYSPDKNVQYGIGSNSYYSYGFKSNIGYPSFSIPVVYKLNKNISFQSGLSYLNIGSKLQLNSGNLYVRDMADPTYLYLMSNNNVLNSVNLQYLSLPLTVKYTIPISGFGFYGRGGAYVSYALGGKFNNNDAASYQNYASQSNYYIRNNKVEFSSTSTHHFDAGLLIGTGGQKELKKGYLFIEAMYMIGLYNINTLSPFYAKTHNSGFNCTAGYMVAFGK